MAIQFVGGRVDKRAAATSGNVTVSLSSGLSGGSRSGVQAGDFVLVGYATAGVADRTLAITDPSAVAYTTVLTEAYVNDSYDTNMRVGYKFMGGSPDATVSLGPTGASGEPGGVIILVFSGVDATTPLDVAAQGVAGTNGGQPNPPSITPTTSGAYIAVMGAAADDPSAITTFFSSDLSGFLSERNQDWLTAYLAIGGGYKAWTSGAFDPAQWTGGSSDATASTAVYTIALRPAPTYAVTPANGAHAHAATSPTLAGKANITPANAAHAHEATSPSIAALWAITVADTLHVHEATSPDLTPGGIAVDSGAHAHEATSPSLAAIFGLSPANAAHGHVATSPSVSVTWTIAPADALHGHSATSPVIFKTVITPPSRRFAIMPSSVGLRRFTVPQSRAFNRRFIIEE